MKSFCRNSGIVFLLFIFAMSIFAPTSASAIGKQKIYELSKQVKELDAQIKEAYAELRRLNEEGGPDAQVKSSGADAANQGNAKRTRLLEATT